MHKKINTIETNAILPYITGISMSGSYTPSDVVTNFINTESFEVLKDGNFHTIFNRVSDVIMSDVLEKGYTEQEIEYIKISCTSNDISIKYNSSLNNKYPYDYIGNPIKAKTNVDVEINVKNTPYIFVEQKNNQNIIKITGTPQQFCPIVVEDENGNSYTQLHNTTSLLQTETFLLTEKTKYIELSVNNHDALKLYEDGKLSYGHSSEIEIDYEVYKNDYKLDLSNDEFEIFINGEKLKLTDFKVYLDNGMPIQTGYKVVNHLIIFDEPIEAGHTITVEYKILHSFYAIIDRENNTTTIYLHANQKESAPKKCKVYFETGTKNNKFIAQDLSLNPIYRTDYKGFIYLTDEHNEPYKLKIYCNPLRLKAGGYDKVDVIIEVLDIKNNPVISKDVAVDCKYGILNCENYETDINGVVHLVYESAYLKCIDTITARVLTDNNTTIEQSITITNE